MIAEHIKSISEDGNTRIVECRIDDILFDVTETKGCYTVYAKSVKTGQGDYYRNVDGLIVVIKAFSAEDIQEKAQAALGPAWEIMVFSAPSEVIEGEVA